MKIITYKFVNLKDTDIRGFSSTLQLFQDFSTIIGKINIFKARPYINNKN